MIGRWSVENFKSIAERASLAFAPLTLFAGQNSAGKSTLIQSILLTAQTLQSTVTSRSVVLNGRILRLGSFQDIRAHDALRNSIKVSFSLEESSFGTSRTSNVSNFGRYYYAHEFQQQMRSVGCSFTFSAGDNLAIQELQLQPRLEAAEIRFEPRDEAKQRPVEFNFHRSSESLDEVLQGLAVKPENVRVSDLSALDFRLDKGWSPRETAAWLKRDSRQATASTNVALTAWRVEESRIAREISAGVARTGAGKGRGASERTPSLE